MSTQYRDPWVDVKTYHGFQADQIISALQKEIRRGNSDNAARLAYEMAITSPALEEYLWYRLRVIAVEDVGMGEPNALLMINALAQMNESFDRTAGERKLFAIHAARYLSACTKDRSSDEMALLLNHETRTGSFHLEIPDYAFDMHTARGQAEGLGKKHFLEEAAKIIPEDPNRDKTYYNAVMQLIESGEME